MTSGVCTRCGRQGEIEYGSDGLSYCSSCAFYGLNKQCWRCRMYLPASELQQYRGQFTCPYCIQDLRDADRKSEERAPEKPHLEAISYPEQCERCGRDLEGRVYIWNGKKLCKSCVNEEQEKWGLVGGGPMAAPYKISLEPEKRRKKTSMIEAIISDALHLLGVKKREKMEVVVVGGKMPIGLAKPLAEEKLASRSLKAERKPEAEGIMPLKARGVAPFELEGAVPKKKEAVPKKLIEEAPREKTAKGKKRRPRRKGAKDAAQDVIVDKQNEKKKKQ